MKLPRTVKCTSNSSPCVGNSYRSAATARRDMELMFRSTETEQRRLNKHVIPTRPKKEATFERYSVGCSSKRLFLNFVPVSGYMVRLGEWSPQNIFSVIDSETIHYRPLEVFNGNFNGKMAIKSCWNMLQPSS